MEKVLNDDKLVCFLYLLMRDHLCTGIIEQITMDVEKCDYPIDYSNGYLAKYAIELNNRLKKE